MSELHHLLTFPSRPVEEKTYLEPLQDFLRSGIPATYTLEQAAAYEAGREDEEDDGTGSNTTPLHILARSLPSDLSESETQCVLKMMDLLFEYGAGWSFLDYEHKAIGDLLLEAGQSKEGLLYQRIIEAGVSAELLLRKVEGGDVEFLDEDAFNEPIEDNHESELEQQQNEHTENKTIGTGTTCEDPDATAGDQMTYLKTKLEYTDDALVTEENRDGVMMEWEDQIMRLAAETMFPKSLESNQDAIVLNIGFGMGIIDTYIQEKSPKLHYICEAHPDVLQKMKQDGWYEKPNVIILEGRWQDTLNKLLDDGEIFFDGIYYDTFSEHYQDMLDLYDIVVGLIKPEGVFSFFNGLGADREICYDVYKKIVEIDVATYGMKCDFETIDITKILPDWKDVKRSYYNCNYYYHPRISFI